MINEKIDNILQTEISNFRDIEEIANKFYYECIKVSNQFSTKYILYNLIKSQREHINSLIDEIKLLEENKAFIFLLQEYVPKDILNDAISDFDLENLNFVESSKLAVLVLESYISFYKQLQAKGLSHNVNETLNRIVQKKQNYIKEKSKDHERLRYKRN